jgi:transcriptional regulator with XRE-family HTH domain
MQQDELAERWHRRLNDEGPLRYLGTLATALRAVRAQAGLSQRDLAREAGVAPSVVAKIEADGSARWDTVLRLIGAAGCGVVVVDGQDRAVLPLRHEGVRDAARRELPPHLEPRPVRSVFGTTERRRPCVPLPEARRPRWTYALRRRPAANQPPER